VHPGLLPGLRGLNVEASSATVNRSIELTGAAMSMFKMYCPSFFTLFRDNRSKSAFIPLLKYPPPAEVEVVVAKAFLAYETNVGNAVAHGAPMRTEFSLIGTTQVSFTELTTGIFDGEGRFSALNAYLDPLLSVEAIPARLKDILTLQSTATTVYTGLAYVCSQMLPQVMSMRTDAVS
jgi:hypothetical protein